MSKMIAQSCWKRQSLPYTRLRGQPLFPHGETQSDNRVFALCADSDSVCGNSPPEFSIPGELSLASSEMT